MDAQQSIGDLIKGVELLQQRSTCVERRLLEKTKEILEVCASTQPRPCIKELLQVEIGKQKTWINHYLGEQERTNEIYSLVRDYIEKLEDHDRLLRRLCEETLEGAWTIALVLDVALPQSTWQVMRYKKSNMSLNGESPARKMACDSTPIASAYLRASSHGDLPILERFGKEYWYH
jgi:hypothetical protein